MAGAGSGGGKRRRLFRVACGIKQGEGDLVGICIEVYVSPIPKHDPALYSSGNGFLPASRKSPAKNRSAGQTVRG